MKIKIYSSPDCPHCIAAKDFFKENKVKYEELSVEKEENAKKAQEISGQTGVPVIVIDQDVIVGFDQEKLKHSFKQINGG